MFRCNFLLFVFHIKKVHPSFLKYTHYNFTLALYIHLKILANLHVLKELDCVFIRSQTCFFHIFFFYLNHTTTIHSCPLFRTLRLAHKKGRKHHRFYQLMLSNFFKQYSELLVKLENPVSGKKIKIITIGFLKQGLSNLKEKIFTS